MNLGIREGWSGFASAPVTVRSLAEWGIDSCKLRISNGGEDELSFTIAPENAAEAFPVPGYYTVVLREDDGTVRFRGLILEPGKRLEGTQRMLFRAQGPACFLQRQSYKQVWAIILENGSSSATASSVAILNQSVSGLTITKTSVRTQIEEVLQQAISGGPAGGGILAGGFFGTGGAVGDAAPISYNLGDLPSTVYPPEEEVTDAFLWDIVRGQLRWCPSIAMRWDYSTATPTLRFHETASDVLVDPGFELGGEGDTAVSFSVNEIEGLVPVERHDLLVKTVRVIWLQPADQTVEGSQTVVNRPLHDVSTVANGAFGEVQITVKIRGQVTTLSGALVEPEDGPFTGLAASLHKPFKRLCHELSFSIMGATCRWSERIGRMINITGAGEELEDARSPLQTLEHDLLHGTTTYVCGPMAHLSFDDLYALARANKRRQVSVSTPDRVTGEGTGNGSPSGGGAAGGGTGGVASEAYAMYVCEGGVPVLKNFLVQAAE